MAVNGKACLGCGRRMKADDDDDSKKTHWSKASFLNFNYSYVIFSLLLIFI